MESQDPDVVRVVMLSRQCGTCDHIHAAPVSSCNEPECSCPGWTPSTAERDEIYERELRELVELDAARTVLSVEVSMRLLDSLADVEQRVHDLFGWDSMPIVLAVSISNSVPVEDGSGLDLVGFGVTSLKLGKSFWRQNGGNVMQTMNSLGAQAALRPAWFRSWRKQTGLDPDESVIAWAWCVEGYARMVDKDGRVGTRRDETRTLAGVDVDGRVYTITRFRSSGEVVQRDVSTRAAHVERRRQTLGDRGGETDGLLAGHRVMAQLVAATTAEVMDGPW